MSSRASSVGFVVLAFAVSRDDSGGPAETAAEFDEVVWCQAANAISAWGGILDGSAIGDEADDVPNLRRALTDARAVAPANLRVDIARLIDLALLTDNAIDDGLDLETALAQADDQTDQVRVAQAAVKVSEALVACGHAPVA